MTERVLAVVSHPDDESLGPGATLAKHIAAGDSVSIVIMADGLSSRGGVNTASIAARHGACRAACKILGTEDVYIHQFADNMMDNVALLEVVKFVERHVERVKPTVVYTHWKGDMNVDHRITHEAVNVACRPAPGCTVRKLLYFEVPCSTAWGEWFAPDYYVPVEDHMETKMAACEVYADELRPYPHPRSREAIRNLALMRGAYVGMPYAEAFVVGRVIT